MGLLMRDVRVTALTPHGVPQSAGIYSSGCIYSSHLLVSTGTIFLVSPHAQAVPLDWQNLGWLAEGPECSKSAWSPGLQGASPD